MSNAPKFYSGVGREHLTDEAKAVIDANVENGLPVAEKGGFRKLAAALVSDSISEAIGKDDLDALVWVSTTAATPWFDAAGVDQLATLEIAGWADAARKALDDPRDLGTRRQRRILSTGLRRVASGSDPAFVPPTLPSKELARERKKSLTRQRKRRLREERAASKTRNGKRRKR